VCLNLGATTTETEEEQVKESDREAGTRTLAEFLDQFYKTKSLKASGQQLAPVPIDPLVVGKKAQDYQREQRERGNQISTTEAVDYILRKGR
jgi:hypothetical protein